MVSYWPSELCTQEVSGDGHGDTERQEIRNNTEFSLINILNNNQLKELLQTTTEWSGMPSSKLPKLRDDLYVIIEIPII